METPKFDLDPESNESFYKYLTYIWDITPAQVKEKFLKDQKCVLCKSCTAYITELQGDIKEAKRAKLALQENQE